MLRVWRRYVAPAAFLLLATPLVVGIVHPDSPAAVLKEGRRLAPLPEPPESGADWLALPGTTEAYLNDHFGLRQVMIRAHKDMTKTVLGLGSDSVLMGRDGRMFYLGEEAVRQSAGLVLRDQRVADTVALLKDVNDRLTAQGVRFLVASPPNAATVYQDDLPDWAKKGDRRTEYDLIFEGLAADGIKAVDLRPVMAATARKGAAYYRHDSHWTPRGALAAYNAIVEADGHPDWRLDPKRVLGPPAVRKGGDLARMLGVQDSVTETVEPFALPAEPKELLTSDPYGDFALTSERAGPTILMIGDSFTAADFAEMLLQHAGKVVWLDHRHCEFDWKAVERFHPDEVWWMTTERFLICDPGARPLAFAG
ncbi:MAG TPA: hypothetical protein VMI72_03740 [Roseiarcus sp.]|nr:hypothetical protein [Roseiarcus sp.]